MRTPRDILERCRALTEALREETQTRERVFTSGTNTSPNLSGMPPSSSAGSKVEVSACKMAELSKRIDEYETALAEAKKDAEELIGRCGTKLQKDILSYFYIEAKTIDEVSFILHYSSRHIQNLKNEAVASL